MKIFCSRLISLLLITFPVSTLAVDYFIDSNDPAAGIALYQLQFSETVRNEPIEFSKKGLLQINLLSLRDRSAMAAGYINFAIGDDWVVQNMVILDAESFPYSHLSVRFELPAMQGVQVTDLEGVMLYSSTPASQKPVGDSKTFMVNKKRLSQDFNGTPLATREVPIIQPFPMANWLSMLMHKLDTPICSLSSGKAERLHKLDTPICSLSSGKAERWRWRIACSIWKKPRV